MKVALVYDRVNKWGGAERVLLALQKMFPDAPLYTSVYNRDRASWAQTFTVKTSFLQQIPYTSTRHEYLGLLMPLAFETFSFDEYDLVISVTSEAAKGIITKPSTKHLCYCLTPTRYLWSGYEEYFKNSLFRALSAPVVKYLQNWDKIASNRPDRIITISEESKRRINKYYQKDASVIYPPVMLGENVDIKKMQGGEYFLVVSRLVPYKRVDLAIAACNELQLPLVIIGTGSEYNRLQGLAGPTITFRGNVTDIELVDYHKNSRGLLFPGKEDFGISIVESQQFGKPVLAFRAGGALETVSEGKTGMFFEKQTVKSMTERLKIFAKTKFEGIDCVTNAKRFNYDQFEKHFLTIIDEVI